MPASAAQDAIGEAWYQRLPPESLPFQGELLWSYPLREVVEEADGTLTVEERTSDLIVLSQGCDLENQKIERVHVAPTHRLEAWIQRNPSDLERMDDIRQGLDTTLYLLPAWPGAPHAELDEDRIVDLADGWTERRRAIERACAASSPRLALRSPALEHFSQAVARSFMRVGLEPGVPSFELQKAAGGGEVAYTPPPTVLERMRVGNAQPMRVLVRHRVRPATGETFVVVSSAHQPPIVGAGRSEAAALASFADRLAARWEALQAGEQRWDWLAGVYR